MDANQDYSGPAILLCILVGNAFVFATILFCGQRKHRCFLFLASSAFAHILFANCLLAEMTITLPERQRQSNMNRTFMRVAVFLVTSVPILNQALVNVSYVLETRKEHAHLNGSRLVAGVMVASPWLYGVILSTVFIWVANLFHSDALFLVALLVICFVVPGLLAVISAAIAVSTFANRKVSNKEGMVEAKCHQGQSSASLHMTEEAGSSCEKHPSVDTSSADVRARSPTAEVIVTAIYIVVVVVVVSCIAVALSTHDKDVVMFGIFVWVLWPIFFPCLCLIRRDFRQASCFICCKNVALQKEW